MTITEKIIAVHAGKKSVRPGEIVNANVDLALANDVTAPIAIREFRKTGAERVFNPEKIVLVPDHFVPNKDIKSAEQVCILREFAKEQGLKHYFEVGRMGIEHLLLPEQGLVGPGDLVIGADSHTCTYGALGAFSTGVGSTDLAAAMATGEVWLRVPETIKLVYRGKLRKWVYAKDIILATIGDMGVDGALYKAMEFTGDTIENLPIAGRLTMANMAVEAGAKNGIVPPDAITRAYVENRKEKRERDTYYQSDPDADYSEVREYDTSAIEPQVAFPHLPSNTVPVNQIKDDIRIDQVVIGSCTNGSLDDLRIAAEVIKGHRVHPGVRMLVIPGTQQIYLDALREGIIETFIEASAAVSTPTCGPCLGGHMGILARGEKAVATTNRNFVGRMGDPQSEVYLANPAIATASAILGKIGLPPE